MTQAVTIASVEQAEDARSKAFQALLDAAEAYPERGTSVQVMQAALAYAQAVACVDWARDLSRRLRQDVELCERLQKPEEPA